MHTDEGLIRQVIKKFEEKTGWGNSDSWTNQDFLQLSELIRDQTGISLSHVTLKRVWGKVKYDSLPNTHTLNTLPQFLGYDNWRDLAAKNPSAARPSIGNLNPSESYPNSSNINPNPSNNHPNPSNNQPNPSNGNPDAPDSHSNSNINSNPPDSHSDSNFNLNTPSSNPNSNYGEFATFTKNPPDTPPPLPNSAARPDLPPATRPESQPDLPPAQNASRPFRRIWLGAPILVLILAVLLYLHGQQPPPQPQDYAFSSKKVVASGLPNSVIFDYDASRSPDDSVIIQQSWDTARRVKVPKSGHQYTSIYYYPDFYHATLRVHGQVVKTHSLLIKSNGWLPLIEQAPVPVYFKKEEAIHDGKIGLTLGQIREKNIPMQPSAPTVMFSNVRDFGEIYSDHFTFETAVKNDYAEGSAACQLTRIYLLCEGTAIWVPLCAKGCISTTDLYFTYFYASGKREDLSNFGVDFSNYVKLRIESDSGRAKIFVNNRLAYVVPRHIRRAKIIGIDYRFQGTGSVDYVYLTNGKVSYRDDFNSPNELVNPPSP